jgi:hypothetical protein
VKLRPRKRNGKNISAKRHRGSSIRSRLLGQGRILFYLGENGDVKEFYLPSVVARLDRNAKANPERARPSLTLTGSPTEGDRILCKILGAARRLVKKTVRSASKKWVWGGGSPCPRLSTQ